MTVGLGLIFITGNASTVTLNGVVAAERKTEHWIYSIKASGVYGESRPPTVEGELEPLSQVVALNAGLQLAGRSPLQRIRSAATCWRPGTRTM